MKSGVRIGFTPQCKCGWVGATHYGKGARGQAQAEYVVHRDRCPTARALTACNHKPL